MRKLMIMTAVAAAGLSSTSNAAITVYTTLAAFNAATTAQGTDTFNTGITPGAALSASLTRTAGVYGYTVSDSATVLYGAGSAADPWLSNDTNAAIIRFGTFTGGVRAAGANFFGSDLAGLFVAAPLGLTVTATDASGTVTQSLISPTQTTFLGFVSTGALTSLTVQATVSGSSYWATVNNLVLATTPTVTPAIPEPATWAMMIGGFGLVGGAMRRRTRQAVRVSFG